jgi:hypothetical protein
MLLMHWSDRSDIQILPPFRYTYIRKVQTTYRLCVDVSISTLVTPRL